MLDGTHYIECICDQSEHVLRCTLDKDGFDGQPQIFVEHFLGNYGFLRRLYISLFYIFGRKCKYGHFSETILNIEQISNLRDLCDVALMAKKKSLRKMSERDFNEALAVKEEDPGDVMYVAGAKMRTILQNREKYLEAWVAATGLGPEESVLIESRLTDGEVKVSVERKNPWRPIDTAPKTSEIILLRVRSTWGKHAPQLPLPGYWLDSYWVASNADGAIQRVEATGWMPAPPIRGDE